jgi:hypothetical protein
MVEFGAAEGNQKLEQMGCSSPFFPPPLFRLFNKSTISPFEEGVGGGKHSFPRNPNHFHLS